MSSHDVAVRRVNISNLMDYVDGENAYENAAQLRLLPGNPLFLEAYVGGGIRSSLAFRASDWDRYASAVRLYDRLMRAEAGEGREVENVVALRAEHALAVHGLKNTCRTIAADYMF